MASSKIRTGTEFYYSGETSTATNYGGVAGAISGDAKTIEFVVMLNKRLLKGGSSTVDNICNIDFLGLNVKQGGKAIDGLDASAKNNGIDMVNTYNVVFYVSVGNRLNMSITKKDGSVFANAQPYDVCYVDVRMGFTITY